MKSDILIVSADMDIGGIERSLVNLLACFDYDNYNVDVYLHSHTGPLLNLLDGRINLLPSVGSSTTFRKSIKQVFIDKYYLLALVRVLARFKAFFYKKSNSVKNAGYYQSQEIWKYSIRLLPKINKQYDIAISYAWPHDFIANKVSARKKIAWIHTDYSTINIDVAKDLAVWDKFDYIISISDACTDTFLKTHPSLKNKVQMVENITSPDTVRALASESLEKSFSDGFNLVSVGRLCDAKAFDRAVDVLAELNNRGYKDINWYIVGEGGDRSLIEAKITEHDLDNRFVLLGSMINPYPYMKAGDIYMQPSRYEGKAVTVTEALILAKPVVITNYPTAPSQINSGVNGIICKQSIVDIADVIEKLYHDKSIAMKLTDNNNKTDYSNSNELSKLYRLLN